MQDNVGNKPEKQRQKKLASLVRKILNVIVGKLFAY